MTTRTHKRGNNYHGVTEKLIGVSEGTLDKFDSAYETLQKKGKKYTKEVERYVLTKPTQSIGIAFAAGFGFAILLRGWLK